MREIKFRAWDIDEKEMIYPSLSHNEKYVLQLNCEYAGEFNGKSYDTIKLPLMQYTGLKDKNNNDIYEGDILQLDGGAEEKPFGQVIFQDGAFRYKAHWLQTNFPELLAYTVFQDAQEGGFKDCITVAIIGNIYETPEFLKHDTVFI